MLLLLLVFAKTNHWGIYTNYLGVPHVPMPRVVSAAACLSQSDGFGALLVQHLRRYIAPLISDCTPCDRSGFLSVAAFPNIFHYMRLHTVV